MNYKQIDKRNIPQINYKKIDKRNIPQINYKKIDKRNILQMNYKQIWQTESQMNYKYIDKRNIPQMNYKQIDKRNIPQMNYKQIPITHVVQMREKKCEMSIIGISISTINLQFWTHLQKLFFFELFRIDFFAFLIMDLKKKKLM